MKVGKRKVELIPEWKKCWKFSSVITTVVLTVLANGYDYIPVIKEHFSPSWLGYILPLIIVARIIKISRDNEEKQDAS